MMGAVASEIERKFLVPAVPGSEELGPGARLRQGYLAIDGRVEVRLRLSEGSATLTVKAGAGLARNEVEAELSAVEAGELWPHTEGRRVEKVRYRTPLATGEVADVDVYDGALAGLATAEVEFTSEHVARAFMPPDWFGRELTGETGWSNASLAVHGRPS